MTLKFQNDLDAEARLILPLLQKYSVNIPRYTSYPTAPEWTESFIEEDFLRANDTANKKKTPISLYFHLPFCESQCYFCACNVVISKKRDVVNPYLTHIKKEIENSSSLIDKTRQVQQIHLGGGTPTYFNPVELKDFFSVVKDNFNISKNVEAGVEIDPRVTDLSHLKTLAELGFNRLSMGIQDFNEKVQEAVNRVQPYDLTENLFKEARELGFQSINVDLIYGLPYQTKESFKKTLELILKLNPDRIALFHYAHLPNLLNHQAKYIPTEALPSSKVKIDIFQLAIKTLTDNGFVYIGLDHFAKPDDELSQAKNNKTLHRNFQGYTTLGGCDLYGFGISAISSVQNIFSQNIKKLNPYYEKLDLNKTPRHKGFVLSKDDELRREIIIKLLCQGIIIKDEIENKYGIKFDQYFSSEIESLNDLKVDGLVILKNNCISVAEIGQFFLRNIASVFDVYLYKNEKQKIYSKSI